MKEQLSVFHNEELKCLLTELVDACNELSQRTPVFGLDFRFYIPGWIGFVQEKIVENRFSKFENKVFYKDKNYVEFANWVVDTTSKIVELHLANKPIETEDVSANEYNSQTQIIVGLTHAVLDAWARCAPEVANTPNRIVKEKYLKSLYRIVYNEAAVELNKIGFRRPPVSKSSEPGCLGELRVLGIRILGYIINIILFSLIFTLIFSIVEAFS